MDTRIYLYHVRFLRTNRIKWIWKFQIFTHEKENQKQEINTCMFEELFSIHTQLTDAWFSTLILSDEIFFFIGVAWCILSVNLNTIFTFPLSYYLLPPPLLSIRSWSQIFFGILILDTKLYESIPFDTICWTLIRQFGNNWYAFSTTTRLSIKLAVWLDSPIYYDYSDSGSRFGTICFRQTCSYVL